MKPVLWIHKASGRIRFHGEELPDSWLPLYSKEDLELGPIKVNESSELADKTKRVWDYIKDRKTPFEAYVVAKHFAISSNAAARHLHSLHLEGMLSRTRKSKKVLWAVKYVEPKEKIEPRPKTPVAVSKPTPEPQPSRPAPINRPPPKIQTSYPHIRGYDD